MLGRNGEQLPEVFFPDSVFLFMHLVLGAGYLGVWLTMGRREWFWEKGLSLGWLKYTLLLLLALDVAVQVASIVQVNAVFELAKGLSLLITLASLLVLLRSKHLKIMLKDWQHAH